MALAAAASGVGVYALARSNGSYHLSVNASQCDEADGKVKETISVQWNIEPAGSRNSRPPDAVGFAWPESVWTWNQADSVTNKHLIVPNSITSSEEEWVSAEYKRYGFHLNPPTKAVVELPPALVFADTSGAHEGSWRLVFYRSSDASLPSDKSVFSVALFSGKGLIANRRVAAPC